MEIEITPELEWARKQAFPVDASRGGDNAFYLPQCSTVQHRPGYCMCLKLIEDRKDGRLSATYAACSAAIGNKTCPALKLRKQEVTTGNALFYVPRAYIQEQNEIRDAEANEKFGKMYEGHSGKREGRASARKGELNVTAARSNVGKTTMAPVKKEPKTDDLFSAAPGYSDAITRAVEAEAKKPEPEVKPVVKASAPTGGLAALAKKMAK